MDNGTLQRRVLRLDDWDAVIAEVDRLAHGYDRAGNLSLGQICNHLAVVLEGAVDGFPEQLPWPVQKLLRLVVLKRMVQHKPTSMRVKAPKFADPSGEVDDAVGIRRLKEAIRRFDQPDVQYHKHLAFGELSREEWKHQQLWHCEHHLSFLVPRGSAA